MTYKQPQASLTDYGVVKVGTNVFVANGVISVAAVGQSYAYFVDETTQTNPVASTPNIVTYSTTQISNNINLIANTQMTVTKSGIYSKFFTLSLQKSSGGNSTVSIWLRRNGTDLVDSRQDIVITNTTGIIFVSGNYMLQLLAGQNIQMVWSSADTTMTLAFLLPTVGPVRPSTASARVQLFQIF